MDLDFNKILDEIGSFGVYQTCLCAFMVVPSALICALIYFTQFFIILVPTHWCSINIPNYENESAEILKDFYIPFELQDGKRVYSNCYIYDEPNVNSTSRMWLNISSHKCMHGWHYDYSSLYPTISSEQNWVCDRDREPYNAQTIFYIGTSIGCLFFGYISDKYGRKPSIIGSSLIACIAGIATAFTYDFWTFTILRFLVGTSVIPLSEDPYVLCLEYIGAEKRTLGIIAWTTGYILASILCPWIAYWLRSWRLLCIVTSVPLILFIISAKLMPESASWLISQGKSEQALKILAKVAKINKTELPVIENDFSKNLLENRTSTNLEVNDTKSNKKLSITQIFIFPQLRKRTIVLAFCWFFLFTCYHTNTQNSSNLGTDLYTSFTYGAMVEIPATIIVFLTLDRIGRRWPMCIAMLVAGLTGLFTLFHLNSDDSSPNLFLTAALIMRVSLATNYNIIIQYSTEVYPTVLRGRSLAILRFTGTLGLYLSPSIVYLALDNPCWPFVLTGLMAIIVSIISLLLPETMNQDLPHTIEEGENFGKNQTIFEIPCIQS